MLQVLEENIILLIPSVTAVIVAFVSYLVVFFKSRKAKLELEQKNHELEQQKLELEKLTYQGSYIICPECNKKIYLSDMTFQVDRVAIKEKK